MSRHFKERIKNRRRWENIRREVIQRDNFRCQSCGRILSYYNFEIDHVKPLHLMDEKEDAYATDNLQTLCQLCHGTKTARENADRRKPKSKAVREWTDCVDELRS